MSKNIFQNPWVGGITSIVAIVSLGLMLLFYFASKKEIEPRYVYQNYEIVSPSKDYGGDLEISFRGERVKKLTSTRLLLKNLGKKPITKDLLVDTDPLRICLSKEVTIFQVEVENTSRDAIDFRVNQDHTAPVVYLGFSFMDENDGALLDIVHDGTTEVSPKILGAIIGAPKGFQLVEEKSVDFSLLTFLTGIAVTILVALNIFSSARSKELTPFLRTFFIIVFSISVIALFVASVSYAGSLLGHLSRSALDFANPFPS